MTVIARDGLTCFRTAILRGLGSETKWLPGKYRYDSEGMALYERICGLPGYYLCRSETRLVAAHAAEIAGLVGPGANLVEFGCGRARKARLLLQAMRAPKAYAAVDLNQEALLGLCRDIAATYPGLAVFPLWADFLGGISLPFERATGAGRILGFFPGATLGSLRLREARDLLAQTSRLIGRNGSLLVSLDERKSPDRMCAAYNDAAGLTAAFNRNLLHRINRELDGDFVPDLFEHEISWNGRESRMETMLVSRLSQNASAGGVTFAFERREPVQTEFAYKHTVEEFRWLAGEAGLEIARTWRDAADGVSLCLLTAA